MIAFLHTHFDDQALRKSNGSLRLKDSSLGESHEHKKTSTQLASDIDDLLKHKEQEQVATMKQRVKYEVDSQHIQGKLKDLGQQAKDTDLDAQYQQSQLHRLKAGMRAMHKKNHAELMSGEDDGKKDSTKLASEVDTLLNKAGNKPTATYLFEKHGVPASSEALPPLDVAEEMIPFGGVNLLQEDDNDDEVIPFVSNEAAAKKFNADHDPAFKRHTNERMLRALNERRAREQHEAEQDSHKDQRLGTSQSSKPSHAMDSFKKALHDIYGNKHH